MEVVSRTCMVLVLSLCDPPDFIYFFGRILYTVIVRVMQQPPLVLFVC